METTTPRTGCMMYGLIAIAAIVLAFASGQVVRSYGGQNCCSPDAGFPLVFINDQTGGSPLHGIGTIGIEDYFPLEGLPLLLNILIYGVSLLFIWLCAQSLYYRRPPAELRYVTPFAWVALMFFIAGSFNYRSLPTEQVLTRVPTRAPTAIPPRIVAMIGTWQATNAEGHETQLVFEADGTFRLIMAEGTWRGTYRSREEGVITIDTAAYADPNDPSALNCERLLAVFATRCVSSPAPGYPAPLTAELPSANGYPALSVEATLVTAPLPAAGYPAPGDALSFNSMTLYHINNDYQIRVEGNMLVLGTFSGLEQSFTDIP